MDDFYARTSRRALDAIKTNCEISRLCHVLYTTLAYGLLDCRINSFYPPLSQVFHFDEAAMRVQRILNGNWQ